MKRKFLLQLLIILGFSYSLTFCSTDDEDCPDIDIPYLVLSFEQSITEEFDTTFIYCPGLSDTLFTGNSNPTDLSIPLNLSQDTTPLTFQLRYADTLELFTDNLFFIHTKEIYSENIECGFQTKFNLQNIYFTSNIIDSIYLLDTIINTDESIHAKIYY